MCVRACVCVCVCVYVYVCVCVLKLFEGLKTWEENKQLEILVMTRLGVTRVETMGIMQWVAIGPFEVVCVAKNAVVIGRMCYIMTH